MVAIWKANRGWEWLVLAGSCRSWDDPRGGVDQARYGDLVLPQLLIMLTGKGRVRREPAKNRQPVDHWSIAWPKRATQLPKYGSLFAENCASAWRYAVFAERAAEISSCAKFSTP
jgi:hypothetical protein